MSIRPLPAELQKIAVCEVNEDLTRIQRDIEHLREWFRQQPHLETIKLDDQWLLAFLRGCKHNLQRTKDKLDSFYSIRNMLPDFFHNRDPFYPKIQEVLKTGGASILPWIEEPASPRVIFIRAYSIDASVHDFADLAKTCTMGLDILLLEDDHFLINGHIVVMDLAGATMGHLMQATFANINKLVVCFERSYPTRPKGIYFVNAPKAAETIYAGIKHIITRKVRNRIKFVQLSDLETLVSPAMLPKEYGGQSTSLDEITSTWKAKIESYRQWYLQEEANCSNESLRVGESNITEDIFGVDGSFRKLEID